jgi:hypothetical protein
VGRNLAQSETLRTRRSSLHGTWEASSASGRACRTRPSSAGDSRRTRPRLASGERTLSAVAQRSWTAAVAARRCGLSGGRIRTIHITCCRTRQPSSPAPGETRLGTSITGIRWRSRPSREPAAAGLAALGIAQHRPRSCRAMNKTVDRPVRGAFAGGTSRCRIVSIGPRRDRYCLDSRYDAALRRMKRRAISRLRRLLSGVQLARMRGKSSTTRGALPAHPHTQFGVPRKCAEFQRTYPRHNLSQDVPTR